VLQQHSFLTVYILHTIIQIKQAPLFHLALRRFLFCINKVFVYILYLVLVTVFAALIVYSLGKIKNNTVFAVQKQACLHFQSLLTIFNWACNAGHVGTATFCHSYL